jgi:ornithine carbamoyltransferase
VSLRHFLRDDDMTARERSEVLDLAAKMREDRFAFRSLEGPRTVALLFDKPSTRTRVSFSVGVAELGGMPLILESGATQFGRGESIGDTTAVLSRQVAAIAWRTFAQANIHEMAAASAVPVINALTDQFHPCQGLADLLTIRDELGGLEGVTFTYVGDCANNMANTYLLACASEGMHVRLAGPDHRRADPAIFELAASAAAGRGGSVGWYANAIEAASGSHVLATDTWHSMGSADLTDDERSLLAPYALTEELTAVADPTCVVLHCLPAYRDQEIAASVMDGARSRVWEQSENRLHVQKALMHWLLEASSTR